jgi:hypothetical protein
MKYRKKPVIIEARQYTRNGLEAEQVAKWCGGTQTDEGLLITTIHGNEGLVEYGSWVIEEPNAPGNFYPCTAADFKATYEPVE